MKNKSKKILFISTALIIINLIATLIYIFKLPDTVPVHWNLNLICDRVGSRWNGLFPSLIMLAMVPLYIISEKKGKNSEKNKKPMFITLIICFAFFIAVNWLLLTLMGSGAHIGDKMTLGFDWLIMLLFGFLFIILGNYMPTVRQNRTLGIRVPWTLNNEKCWNISHRFAGKVYVIGGLLILALTMIGKIWNISNITLIIYVAVILPAAIILPLICAYIHRND